MSRRLARFLLPITCACVLVAALPAMAQASTQIGISDNADAMFSSPYFLKLNLTIARDMVPWNAAVMRNKSALRAAQAWVAAANADGVQPMITFAADGGNAGNYVPSTKVYKAAMQAFVKAVPSVTTYAPWNEPDWVYRPALAKNPKLAASYFNALIQVCHHCTVVAGEVYLPATGRGPLLGPWLRSYERYLAAKPKAWALHNYYDVRSHTTKQLQTMESLIPKGSQIWLTEISGVIRRGHWQYPNQSSTAAARDESFLYSLPNRFHNITRIYHYEWLGTVDGPDTGWDSGLIGPKGVPRPAYYVLAKAVGPRQSKRRPAERRK